MSDAREEILGRVRAALDGAPAVTGVPPVPRREAPPGTDLVARFAERVADYRAVVQRCVPDELAAVVAAALPVGTVVVPEGIDLALPDTVTAVVDGAGGHRLGSRELDEAVAVVTRARVGIAETGTVVLDHGPGQGRRALSLVPDLHVCLVSASQVVADVPQAVAVLDPLRPQTWISGPSATSDIELSRVEGVHGPRRLHVVIVDEVGRD